MKLIYVTRTSNAQLSEHNLWASYKGSIYVACDSKGVVNWDKTFVYTLKELLERGKTILK